MKTLCWEDQINGWECMSDTFRKSKMGKVVARELVDALMERIAFYHNSISPSKDKKIEDDMALIVSIHSFYDYKLFPILK